MTGLMRTYNEVQPGLAPRHPSPAEDLQLSEQALKPIILVAYIVSGICRMLRAVTERTYERQKCLTLFGSFNPMDIRINV